MSQSLPSDLTAVSVMRQLGLEPDPTRPLGPRGTIEQAPRKPLGGLVLQHRGTPAGRAREGSLRAFLRGRVRLVSRIQSHVRSRLLSLVVRREKVMLGVWLPT